MDIEKIKLGIRGIHELEKRRDSLSNDIELSIVRIKTLDEEIKELTMILANELVKR